MKTILVTGASRGLGKSLTEVFLKNNWKLIASARDISKLDSHENLIPLELDLSSEDSLRQFIEEVKKLDLEIDLLINNAGYNAKDSGDNDYFQSTFRIEHFSAKAVDDTLLINALMPMQLISGLLKVLSSESVVLNISSWLGSITEKKAAGHYAYSGSKALLNMFTRGFALELEKSDISKCQSTVALNPGWMQTDMGGAKAPSSPQDVAEKILGLYDSKVLQDSNGKFLNVDGTEHLW